MASFGNAAAAVERRYWADSRSRGVMFVVGLVGAAGVIGYALERAATGRVGLSPKPGAPRPTWPASRPTARGPIRDGRCSIASPPAAGRRSADGARHPLGAIAATAVATWIVLGGTSLAGEAAAMGRLLRHGDIPAARVRLSHLCGRDAETLDADELARATVESIAENTCDAVVAPLLWGAVAGVPGLLAYRAINTLDAMVGHRGPRYARFGWAAARLDDAANYVPARVTAYAAALFAPAVGGSTRRALRVLRRDGADHPSPNAGPCEAAYAGALDVRLGGRNFYGGRDDRRGPFGDGSAPTPRDIARAIRLSRLIGVTVAVLSGAAAMRQKGAPAARTSNPAAGGSPAPCAGASA